MLGDLLYIAHGAVTNQWPQMDIIGVELPKKIQVHERSKCGRGIRPIRVSKDVGQTWKIGVSNYFILVGRIKPGKGMTDNCHA